MQAADCLSALSKCVRCGSCKAQCPTYQDGLTEAAGARGRLALISGLLAGQLKQSPALNERIFNCILCGACESLCPPKVDITEAIYHARSLLKKQDNTGSLLRFLVLSLVQRPALGFRLANILQTVNLSTARLSAFTGAPFNITLPRAPLKNGPQVYKPVRKKAGRVAVFTGCSINFLLPRLGTSLINVLLCLGYEVILPKGEVCCGIPLRGLGMEEEAAKLAEKNYELFSSLKVDAVLSLCPTCILALNIHYPRMIGRGLDVMDASVFLSDKLKTAHVRNPSSLASVTYHDPCHLSYSLGIRQEPRQLIRFAGAELREAKGEGCCGFGGTFSIRHKETSVNVLKKRVSAYADTGADSLVTSCPGCMLQLGRAWDSNKVFHVIELIEKAIC